MNIDIGVQMVSELNTLWMKGLTKRWAKQCIVDES